MSPSDGTEPIKDDEILYRRIPVSQKWFDPTADPRLSPQAFHPIKQDTTGLSLSRAKYKTVEEAAEGPSAQGYYVAGVKAGELRERGIAVIPDPLPDDPGHCELPGLTYSNRHCDQSEELKVQLAHELTWWVAGPFLPPHPVHPGA
jgi:hypothetical protein